MNKNERFSGPQAAVLYQKLGAVAVLQLNRPERYNAFNDALVKGISASLDQAAADPSVRVILIHGAGPGFSAGADLDLFSELSPEQGRDYIKANYRPLMEKMCRLPKPILAAIHGTVAGIGCALALACDLRIMADTASFRYAFINIGLGPDGGAGWFLVRAVGYGRAMEIACGGEKIPAGRCLELGLTNRVVAEADLLAAAQAWARDLAAKAPLAMAVTKADLQFAQEHPLGATIDFEADQQMIPFASEDLREGIRAFLSRQQPHFQGK